MILPVARATETPRLELGQALVFLYGFFAFAAGGGPPTSSRPGSTRRRSPSRSPWSPPRCTRSRSRSSAGAIRGPGGSRSRRAASSWSASSSSGRSAPRTGLVPRATVWSTFGLVRILPALPPDRRIDLAAPARDPARVSGELAGVASASPWRAAPTSAGSRASASGSTSSGRGRSRAATALLEGPRRPRRHADRVGEERDLRDRRVAEGGRDRGRFAAPRAPARPGRESRGARGRKRAYAELRDCRRGFVLNYFGEAFKPRAETATTVTRGGSSRIRRSSHSSSVRGWHTRSGAEGEVQRYEGDKMVVLFDGAGYKTLAVELVAERKLLRPA